MITVIIVNYCCAEQTITAVNSVLSEAETSEVIVVDNSVNEQEAQTLKNSLDGNVRLIINPNNSGFAAACNLAYRQSHGDSIFLLNPDAYILPGCLSILHQSLDTLPHAGAVGPQIYWDDQQQFFLPPSMFPTPYLKLAANSWRIHPRLAERYSKHFHRLALSIWLEKEKAVPIPALSGGHILINRSAIQHCDDLFDERFFMYYEDSDLMIRLKRAGFRQYVVPEAKCVHHYVHNAEKFAQMEHSEQLYFQKNFPNHWAKQLNTWLEKRRFTNLKSVPKLEQTQNLVDLEINPLIAENGLFEISHSPFFAPSIGAFFNHTLTFSLDNENFERLEKGTYYIRLSSTDRKKDITQQWQWQKT